MPAIRLALISVSDKTGIVEFCQGLHQRGIKILSTGGTAGTLSEQGIPVVEVSDHTGFPEMMAGRVKTLHPKIHGGILGRLGEDEAVMQDHGIDAIGLVVVNLYPFEATIQKPDVSLAEAIENIDIGGPAMVRSAAKNHQRVGVVVDHNDYARVLKDLDAADGALTDATRYYLAHKAFAHTANYDANISNYLGSLEHGTDYQLFPKTYTSQFHKRQDLRYGENPHQAAAFYQESHPASGTLAAAEQLQGKELSYNNIADTDAAWSCVLGFEHTACVIVKHANPCGVAVADTALEAYQKAYQTDPTSAFGGIIAFNRELDENTARVIIEQQFVEVIIAPTITATARDVLATKTSVRVLAAGCVDNKTQQMNLKRVSGGLLIQTNDLGVVQQQELQVVTERKPTIEQLSDLQFAWRVVKYVKSNAIVYAHQHQTIGIGAGQMSRVYSAKIAAIKAADEGLVVDGAVMASDAFFPFRDGIDSAAAAGIRAVIQPGGSMRDDEVIAAANEHGIAMVFTGMRHFLH